MASKMNDYNEVPKNPVAYALLSLFCGIIGVVIVFQLEDYAIAGIASGAVGLFIGGYAISVANHFPGQDRIQFILLAGVGLMASVIAFMLGIVYAVQ